MQLTKIVPLCISTLLFLSFTAQAHRPFIVKDQSSKDKPVMVKEPEISYAYYGQLVGKPQYYKIVYHKEFVLYANILVPDFYPKAAAIDRHDMSFQILTDEKSLFMVKGDQSQWKRFYEPYGRDHYYMGTEFERRVPAGTYHIKVFNDNNMGKYALAIGKKESFTPWGLVGAIIKARSLDKWFFKPDTGGESMEASKTLIDFSKTNEKRNWHVVNDVVMGGVSQSEITITADSTAIFQGTLSLDNNGGFASVRVNIGDYKLAGYYGIIIRIRGDGRKYQLRLRTDDRLDGISYQSEFQTTDGEWIKLRLPFSKFIATFHGQRIPDAPELFPDKIHQIGFLIADRKEGSFRLEIDWIGAYMEGANELDLDDYKWKNRLLLIFSLSEFLPDYKAQKREIENRAEDMEDRDLIMLTILGKGESNVGNLPISYASAESMRNQFEVKSDEFVVILIGKDGGEKFRSMAPVSINEIFSLIDAMPMRKSEMQDRRK